MRARRGFTLIEMMVAVLVATIGVVLAAKVAQVVIHQSTKGRQSTDFHARARLVTRQLRADLRSAGVGSTGLVTVDRGIWGVPRIFSTPAGFDAIPAVIGLNNVVGAIGGRTIRPNSDVVQVIVPDPDTAVRTNGINPSGQNIIGTQDPLTCPGNLVYVSDNSSPTGQGRAQLFFATGFTPNSVVTAGNLQFTVAVDSNLMCARMSVYWVDDQAWLHRSDLSGQGAGLDALGGIVFVDNGSVATDMVSPGVLDLQIAYRISAELYRQNGAAVPVGVPRAAWAFEGDAATADATFGYLGPAAPEHWSEVRMVRVNMLMRTMRRVNANASNRNIARREDAAALPPIPVTRALQAEWVTATEPLTNLRYFDLGAPAGVVAEPY